MALSLGQAQWLIGFMRNLPGGSGSAAIPGSPSPHAPVTEKDRYFHAMELQRQQAGLSTTQSQLAAPQPTEYAGAGDYLLPTHQEVEVEVVHEGYAPGPGNVPGPFDSGFGGSDWGYSEGYFEDGY